MKQKLFGRLAAAAVLLLSATTAMAHDFEVDGIFYNTTAVERERETLVGFFIVFDVVSTCVIFTQIRESTCQLFSFYGELNGGGIVAI